MKDIVKKEQKLQVRSKILEAEKALIPLVDGKNIVKGDTKVFPLEHMFVDGVQKELYMLMKTLFGLMFILILLTQKI